MDTIRAFTVPCCLNSPLRRQKREGDEEKRKASLSGMYSNKRCAACSLLLNSEYKIFKITSCECDNELKVNMLQFAVNHSWGVSLSLDELALLQYKNRVVLELDRHICLAVQSCSIPLVLGKICPQRGFRGWLEEVLWVGKEPAAPTRPQDPGNSPAGTKCCLLSLNCPQMNTSS